MASLDYCHLLLAASSGKFEGDLAITQEFERFERLRKIIEEILKKTSYILLECRNVFDLFSALYESTFACIKLHIRLTGCLVKPKVTRDSRVARWAKAKE